jgi:hypothetical protein
VSGDIDPRADGNRDGVRKPSPLPSAVTPTEKHSAIVCHLLVRHYRELIAYGAGWTDPERQQPVGNTGRHEPRQLDAIVDAELDRALADPDPLRAVASSPLAGRPPSCSTRPGSPAPKHSAPSGWRARYATRSPAAKARCVLPYGS